MTEYVNIKIPKELGKEIDEIVDKHIKGYTSRGEFVKCAVRAHLKEIKNLSSREQHAPKEP